jgi:hypothetical protein
MANGKSTNGSAVLAPAPFDLPEGNYDRRRVRRTFPKEPPYLAQVYGWALAGWSAPRIIAELEDTYDEIVTKSRFSKHYQQYVEEARLLNPEAWKRTEDIRLNRLRAGNGTAVHLDETELRKIAATTAPDTIIAVHFKIDVKTLRTKYRHIIDEERARLGLELAQSFVEKAKGKPAVKEMKDGVEVTVAAAVEPDTALGEKILNRIGFFEAPMQSEFIVTINHAPPPTPAAQRASNGKDRGTVPLPDLGDDDEERGE